MFRDAPLWGWVVFALHSGLRGWVSVSLNQWYKEFYDMVSREIIEQGLVVAKLYKFGELVLPLLVCEPLLVFAKNHWGLRWRLNLVRRLLGLRDAAGRQIMVTRITIWNVEGSSQRIQEDSFRLVKGITRLLGIALDSLISLCLFSGVLWQTKLCHPWGAEEPMEGWLYLVCIVSCLLGLCVSWCLGSRLVCLENVNQQVEACFRKLLLQLECATDDPSATEMRAVNEPVTSTATFEEISLLSAHELWTSILCAVTQVLLTLQENYHRLYACWVRLSCFLGVFEQCMVILPYVLVSPWLVGSGQQTDESTCGVTLGTMVAVSNCFQKVFQGLNSISDHMVDLTELRSVVLRLQIFETRCVI